MIFPPIISLAIDHDDLNQEQETSPICERVTEELEVTNSLRVR